MQEFIRHNPVRAKCFVCQGSISSLQIYMLKNKFKKCTSVFQMRNNDHLKHNFNDKCLFLSLAKFSLVSMLQY